MTENLIDLAKRINDVAKMAQKHDDDLYRGNGKGSITTRIWLTENNVAGVREIVEKIEKNSTRLFFMLLATLLGLGVNIVIHFLGK